jgi:hypothetical protein
MKSVCHIHIYACITRWRLLFDFVNFLIPRDYSTNVHVTVRNQFWYLMARNYKFYRPNK